MRELIWSMTKNDCIRQTFRAGGPGGQHQNKTETAVRFIHKETGIAAESREFKSQRQNEKAAFKKLATRVMAHLFPKDSGSERTEARVRTYNAVTNRVKDADTGVTYRYDDVMSNTNKFAEMIEQRAYEMSIKGEQDV